MVDFDVTCDGAPGPALLATTIAGNQLLSMGPKADAKGGPGSPVIYPASGLWTQAKKQGGARGGHSPSRAGWKMAKIILAEDDNDMRRFLVKALQNAGYDVISFDNGLSAYQRLREEPFELLLTDIVMPEMDGIELARRASELDPDIKIMFITGFAAVALNSDSAAPKNAKVLSKPVHLRELVNEVQKMLAA
jgi:two-component system, cell cycle response regulator CpdR